VTSYLTEQLTEHVYHDITDGIATITLDRPERRNALTYPMLDAVRQAVYDDGANRDVRAIVFTGTPGVFCAGTDLTQLHDVAPGTDPEDRTSHTDGSQWFFYDVPKPTIAVVDGPAAGFGVEMATQCDFRIASTRARFSWIFVQRGLIPDAGAGTWLLPQIIGVQQAKRLMYSGEFIDAAEAERLGFVLELVEPDRLVERARAFAHTVSSGSPFALERIKRLVNHSSAKPREQHLHENVAAMTECQLSADHREGVAAFLEKRPAVFTGR
jgi:2-(1,2-epoxy-1,2-dihydrophenyl)acetyl-CoA isomerase